jgi:hypothetical protein
MKKLKRIFNLFAGLMAVIIGSLFGVDFTADYEEEY